MSDHVIAHFQNDAGCKLIEIGVKEFMCIGATPPLDHPHIFIDMGADDEKICPYCSTLYRYTPDLSPTQSKPDGCFFHTTASDASDLTSA